MLFNSFDYAIFFPFVFFLYWFVFRKNVRVQNGLLLVASYVFYGWWDVRYLALMVATSLIDFFIALALDQADDKRKRKFFLGVSLVFNLGVLGVFKYYDFFITSFAALLESIGFQANISTLQLVLPVGVSFYTFQSLSYTIDVYRKQVPASKNVVEFLSFVSFFPQLVAGPIERASHFIPQFKVIRKFDYIQAVEGCRFILWGLFKKIVIADNCAVQVNSIFDNYQNLPGSTLALGAFFFAFQIYGDFSGYSDIAVGSARLMGFNLMRNFAYPYFSRDISEFWRRWHISLSSWFKDYVYIPLGGSKGSKSFQVRNTMIVFLVSGLWHGANWTFVLWGLLNALYFLPLLLTNRNRVHLETIAHDRRLPSGKEFGMMLMTFALTCFAWIFFRAESASQAFSYVGGILSIDFFSLPSTRYLLMIPACIALIVVEWLGREDWHPIHFKSTWVRWVAYFVLVLCIMMFMPEEQSKFIYFQF